MDRRKQIKWFKENIDIREYLVARGYKVDKSRDAARFRAFVSADGHEKLVVPINDRYPVPSFYFNQHDPSDKGSIIDFVASRENKTLAEVCETLQEFEAGAGLPAAVQQGAGGGSVAKRNASHQYVIGKIMADAALDDISYLTSRCIEQRVLADPIFKGCVASHVYGEEVFAVYPFYDAMGVVRGLWMKNDQSRRFIGHRMFSLWYSGRGKAPVERLIINESPEESLAHRNLRYRLGEAGRDFYIAAGGNITDGQVALVQQLIDQVKPFCVVVAMNNDKAGGQYKSKLVQALSVPHLEVESPQFNDFNCDLVAATRYTSEERRYRTGSRVAVEMPPAMKRAFNEGNVEALDKLVAGDPRLVRSQGVYTLDEQLYLFSMAEIAAINKKEQVIEWVAQLKT